MSERFSIVLDNINGCLIKDNKANILMDTNMSNVKLNELYNIITDLKGEVAKKEKEITDFELEVGDLRLQNRNLKEQFKYAVQSKNQDKISFAIAELEKMRDWCIGINENNKMYGFPKEPNLENCADIAQNRINDLKKQLKEGNV